MTEHRDSDDGDALASATDASATQEANDPTAPYVIGYGRPPKSGQIKPGEVRNPRGKAKGTRSFRNDVAEVLAMPVPMVRDGRTQKVSTRKASLLKLREKALKGDSRSLERLFQLAEQHIEDDATAGNTKLLLADDQQILANARARDRTAANAAEPALPDAKLEKDVK